MGATGTATLNFGAFPGSHSASVAVTGQTGIVSGSLVEAWIRPVATADHTADEHIVAPFGIFGVIAADIVAGTGFTIHGVSLEQGEPGGDWADGRGTVFSTGGGSMPWGQWTIAWAWN